MLLRSARVAVFAIAAALVTTSCAARARPLTGVAVSRNIPATALPPGHNLVVFMWTLEDQDMLTRGEGAVRTASPDSARLDFFLSGGLGSGAAIMIGPELRTTPGTERIKGLLMPPAPLLWAVAGRAAPPTLPDTVMRVDGDTLRVDIGKPLAWRLTFARDSLRRVEFVSGGRIVEWVTRSADGRVRYRNQSTRRTLEIVITKVERTKIDASAWTIE